MKAPKSREAPNKGTQSAQESEPTATSSVFHALDVDYDRVSIDVCAPKCFASSPPCKPATDHRLRLACTAIKQQSDMLLLSAAGPAAPGI